MIPQEGKKPRKVPFYISHKPRSGKLDSPEDLAQLAHYEDAVKALSQRSGYAGLGFALGPDGSGNYWQGLDFDGMGFNGPEVSLLDLLDLNCGLRGYREMSPSGQGWHFIGYGKPFKTMVADHGLEGYCEGRFFTVTGREGDGDIEDLSDYVAEVQQVHARWVGGRDEPQRNQESEPVLDPLAALEDEDPGADDETLADLWSALSSMPSDDRELWVRMGQAMKSLKGLEEEGKLLWLDWSRKSHKFDAADAERVWASFNPTHTGYGAVFAEAQRRGWENPRRKKPEAQGKVPVPKHLTTEQANAKPD